nr:thiol:disulfide interchange protein DsbG [Halomonas socia]
MPPLHARLSAVLLALLPAGAVASDWPAPIAALQAQGMTIHGEFEALGGMTGYAGSYQGHELAAYLLPDGEHVIVGTLQDAEGNDLSRPMLDEVIRGEEDGESLAMLEQSAWIAEGEAERIVYVFTDPYCPYCQRLFDKARPWVEAGEVQLRHVMVGLMERDSPRTAISLLAADDPSAALLAHHRGEETPRLETLPRDLEEALFDNHQLMESFGLMATPSMVYQGERGLQMAHGLPDEDELAAIFGAPHP